MIERILSDWLGGATRVSRTFIARIEEDPNDVYVQIFDTEADKFPLATIQIENDNGKLVLRVWGDANQDPIRNFELPSDRSELPYCLVCGDDFHCHNDDGSCVNE